MLHRVTTLLSAVVVAFVAANVLNAVSPVIAQAADSCRAKPTGSPPSGSHWYYRYDQTNRVTLQKCWVLGGTKILDTQELLGAGKAAVRNVALQGWFDVEGSSEPAEPATAASCVQAPNQKAAQGRRWSYRTDGTTGQRCWRLSALPSKAPPSKARISKAQASRFANVIPARTSEPAKMAAPEMTAAALPQAVADARAELEAAVVAPLGRVETASLPQPVATEAADAFLATSTFASRWSNPLGPAPSGDRRPGPPGNSEIDQPVPAALHDVTNSTKTSDRLFTAERPLYVTLVVFLASLGGALVLCGLIGGAFLYLRSMPAARRNLPPRRNVFRDGTHPVPVRPGGNAGNIAESSDPSNPDSPGIVKPAGIRRDGADGHQAERDQRIVVDALLRQAGARQIDRASSRGAGGDRRIDAGSCA
jgi:hypothetical protein